jgi:hypothetical protein
MNGESPDSDVVKWPNHSFSAKANLIFVFDRPDAIGTAMKIHHTAHSKLNIYNLKFQLSWIAQHL